MFPRSLALSAVPFAALLAAAPAQAQDPAPAPAITLAEARASTAGTWRGELQYRDYQSDEWVGIPVTVTVEPVGDGVTLVRRAVFDDGPRRGAVYITSVAMLAEDGATEYAASFRADRPASSGAFTLALTQAGDAGHWTIVATQDGEDDDRPAHIRETTVRDGDRLTTLKEVDFTDDDTDEWLARNRTVLERAGD